jgi:hypothetical protein
MQKNYKKILLTSLLFSFIINLNAQQQEGTRVQISNTGCTVQVICFPGRFDAYDLEDGSTVYADDCLKDEVTYGIYCVKLKKPISDIAMYEDSIASYLDFMKLDYGIVKSKGYDKGHELNKDESTRGIYDTWEDADKNKWKVRAWTNGIFVCVLFVYSAKELPEKKTDIFLNGLLFPDMKEKMKNKEKEKEKSKKKE